MNVVESASRPTSKVLDCVGVSGATRRIRTDDLLITNNLAAPNSVDDPAKSSTKSRKTGG
jgi:hypothetical protein